MRVAIIHYWLVNVRGGEKVIESLCELFPQADIFTHVYNPDNFKNSIISQHNVQTSFISGLPKAKTKYQSYLPLMPMALEELDLSGYDLVISSESGPAKGVIVPPGVPHICYCHSPMRYAWDMYHDYKQNAGWLKRKLMTPLMHYIRRWDQLSAQQVTHYIANSSFVAKRISSYYGKQAEVIHPPVSVDDFEVSENTDEYYLMLGQLVAYKKADLAVRAFNESGKKLIIVGEGEQLDELRKQANSNIQLLGRQPFSEIKRYLSNCKALIFPGVEDFGIVPVEAMACGKPVIAYAKGGALETVVDGKTGLYFHEQTEKALNEAIEKLEDEVEFTSREIRNHAESFSKEIFKQNIQSAIKNFI
ncbi:glycosyl transferase [Vibrio albus]|uniref:Glycosyl transferase n=1 Tax=Vibrio albus TaxID=2200953 RepID=A0A2U3BCN4_9VIBR|nr:glycosyltransferase family 4 protein [Vibrio albus]PWI34551.1 glycosyl transferase [Vibrio albus]